MFLAQDDRRLRHEVDAAEDDALRTLLTGGELRELERVAAEIGEPDDLVPLVVVAENDRPLAEPSARFRDPHVKLFRLCPEVGDRNLLPPDSGLKLLFERLCLKLLVRLAKGGLLDLGYRYGRCLGRFSDYHVASIHLRGEGDSPP